MEDYSKVDFKYLSPVKRLIKEMLVYWGDHRRQGTTSDQIKYQTPLHTDFFTTHEDRNPSDYSQTLIFLKWLRENNAIEFSGETDDRIIDRQNKKISILDFPSVLEISIRDNHPIEFLHNLFQGQVSESEIGENYYFYMDNDFNFSYGKKDKRNSIDFKSHNYIYYKVFRVLYELGTGKDKIVSYEEIDNFLVNRLRQKPKNTFEKRKKRIQGAVKSLFKLAKRINLPLKIGKSHKDIIELIDGEGYKFYNPYDKLD